MSRHEINNSLFVSFKEYKAFITLKLSNNKKEHQDYLYSWFNSYTIYFFIEFTTKSIYAYIIIILFKKYKIRKNNDINNSFELLKNKFLNLVRRKFEMFKEKYYKMIKEKVSEVRNNYGYMNF